MTAEVVEDVTLKLNITVIDVANYLFELVDRGDPNFTAICDTFLEKLRSCGEVFRCPDTPDAIKAFVRTNLTNDVFLARADEIFRTNAQAFDRGHHTIKRWEGGRLFEDPSEGPAKLLLDARHFLKMW